MKTLILSAVVFTVFSTSTTAKNKITYADIQVTDIDPTSDFIWERANQNTPRYPIELARPGISGCAVLSFNISDSGKT